MNSNPLVIIRCIAFNHEPYIRQCLDGFVMQKTTFPFYAVVHDDASTDGTANIVREYAENYPDIIHPIFETENQYSKHDGSLRRIMDDASKEAKYIAICEGDDYWMDPLKLQKQVDFLETHEDFSICFHEAKVFCQAEARFIEDDIRSVPSETDIMELARGNYIHTMTVVYRNNPLVLEEKRKVGRVAAGDYVLHMLNAKYGKIKKLPDCMAVYRLNNESIWGTKEVSYRIPLWNEMLIRLIPFFEPEVQKVLHEQYMQNCNCLVRLGADQVRKSKAYRLGKFFLKPFSWIKNKRED